MTLKEIDRLAEQAAKDMNSLRGNYEWSRMSEEYKSGWRAMVQSVLRAVGAPKAQP